MLGPNVENEMTVMDNEDPADPSVHEPTEVWGIAVMAPKQRPAAEKHCFGDCGKISMAGAINDDLTGGLFVCCQPTCPYEAQVMPNYGNTMSFGRPHTVHLRLLKEEA